MEVAVGAGADDYSDAGEEWSVTTPPDMLGTVLDSLEKAQIAAKGNLAYLPKNKKLITGRDAEVAIDLADVLDDHDDVQNVYADFDVSDEEMAKLST
jgi:transcriptional/translational regulatory protein YebC/TACO1